MLYPKVLCALLLCLIAPVARAQNLPPVAAPTDSIAVGSLPVVRSESEETSDFVDGLVQGLMGAKHITALAIALVKEDRVVLARGFGPGTDADTPLTLGTLSDVVVAIAQGQGESAMATASGMGRLQLAMLNGRANLPDERRAAVFTPNGWRALQYDAAGEESQSRLVLIPEARAGYFASVRGMADAEFWRLLDEGLLGRVLQAREQAGATGDTPVNREAEAAAGLFRPAAPARMPLTLARGIIRLKAEEGGRLTMSGAMSAVLYPQAGGFWRSNAPYLEVSMRGDEMLVNGAIYVRRPLWQNPVIYLLVVFVGILAIGVAVYYARTWGGRRGNGALRGVPERPLD